MQLGINIEEDFFYKKGTLAGKEKWLNKGMEKGREEGMGKERKLFIEKCYS